VGWGIEETRGSPSPAGAVENDGELVSLQLESESLGIRGRVDAIRRRDGRLIPYEHKKGRARDGADGPVAWDSHGLQVPADPSLDFERSRVGAVWGVRRRSPSARRWVVCSPFARMNDRRRDDDTSQESPPGSPRGARRRFVGHRPRTRPANVRVGPGQRQYNVNRTAVPQRQARRQPAHVPRRRRRGHRPSEPDLCVGAFVEGRNSTVIDVWSMQGDHPCAAGQLSGTMIPHAVGTPARQARAPRPDDSAVPHRLPGVAGARSWPSAGDPRAGTELHSVVAPVAPTVRPLLAAALASLSRSDLQSTSARSKNWTPSPSNRNLWTPPPSGPNPVVLTSLRRAAYPRYPREAAPTPGLSLFGLTSRPKLDRDRLRRPFSTGVRSPGDPHWKWDPSGPMATIVHDDVHASTCTKRSQLILGKDTAAGLEDLATVGVVSTEGARISRGHITSRSAKKRACGIRKSRCHFIKSDGGFLFTSSVAETGLI
jgi:hypothetical protein